VTDECQQANNKAMGVLKSWRHWVDVGLGEARPESAAFLLSPALQSWHPLALHLCFVLWHSFPGSRSVFMNGIGWPSCDLSLSPGLIPASMRACGEGAVDAAKGTECVESAKPDCYV
jgi:hypothetical protein